MKKLYTILFAAVLCAAMLAGCGSSAASSGSAASSEAVSSSASVTASEVADTAKLEAAVAAIEEVNPVANARAIDDFSVENEMYLTLDNLVAYKGDVTNDQADCALVFVAQAKNGSVDAVVSELEAYKATLAGNDLYAEFADKVAQAQDARIVANGNYVAMVIAGVNGPDYSAIDDIIGTALAG